MMIIKPIPQTPEEQQEIDEFKLMLAMATREEIAQILLQLKAEREAVRVEKEELIAQIERVYVPCEQANTYPH